MCKFQHFGNFEPFAEKRLVWKGHDSPAEKGSGDRPRRRPKMTRAQLLEYSRKKRRELKGQVEAKPGERKTPSNRVSTTAPGATREVTRHQPRYPKSAEIARNAEKTRGYLSPVEVQRMQHAHERIYEHYMNPAFLLYLRQINKSDQVFMSLNLILETPDAFEYQDKGNNVWEIVPKQPNSNPKIPNSFRVVLKGAKRLLAYVNGVSLEDEHTKQIKWVDQSTYSTNMSRYRARWNSEVLRYYLSQPEQNAEARQRALDAVSGPMKEFYEVDNIELPKRFIELVRKRNQSWELNDARFQDLVQHFNRQGENYEEMMRNAMDGFYVGVMADPENPGGYMIATRSTVTRGTDYYLHVSKEGYILDRDSQRRWRPDPRYNNAVLRKYYEDHEAAHDNLSETQKNDLRRMGATIARNQQEREQLERERAERRRVEENRRRVDEAVDAADITKLREAAKVLIPPGTSPANIARGNANIDAMNDPAPLRNYIKTYLDSHPDSVDDVAAVFPVPQD